MTHPIVTEARERIAFLLRPVLTPNMGQGFGDIAQERNLKDAALLEQLAGALDQLTAPLPEEIAEIEQHYRFKSDSAARDIGLVISALRSLRAEMKEAVEKEKILAAKLAMALAYGEVADAIDERAKEIEDGDMDAAEVRDWLMQCASATRARASEVR